MTPRVKKILSWFGTGGNSEPEVLPSCNRCDR